MLGKTTLYCVNGLNTKPGCDAQGSVHLAKHTQNAAVHDGLASVWLWLCLDPLAIYAICVLCCFNLPQHPKDLRTSIVCTLAVSMNAEQGEGRSKGKQGRQT